MLAAATLAAVPAGAEDVSAPKTKAGAVQPAAGECAARYGAALKRIGAEDLGPIVAAAKAAPAGAAPAPEPQIGDPSLPGTLLFVAQPRPRSPAEIGALTAAVALARSKGRSAAVVTSDKGPIAARLREDLSDYLNQKPTPYLCSGVADYLRTLRSFAAKLGPAPDQRARWIATQQKSAERALVAAAEAIRRGKPVVTGSIAPAAPVPPPGAEAAPPTAAPVATNAAAANPAPADVPPPLPAQLAGPGDMLAAVDGLVAQARAAHLVVEQDAPAAQPAPAPIDPAAHPVLAKLASVKPYVVSARPLIQDQPARLKVLAAFADLEMLTYLLEAKEPAADPVATALHRTLDDIETAHAAECTCAP
ncbi:hypothetical protein GCM10011390_15190 [Aureimonas endophytica]|uniref:Uncharacterized protein n=1 Tax=Aureimonas endophytica TaxID=2027858 RepID=A0A916ZH14_9HYPH|nr:hypothetical protein GCM10011390_15190 [Aureimonas endophytica]